MTDFDPRADTGIPTEPVGSLPRPARAPGGVRGLRRGQDRQGRARGGAGRRGPGLDRAVRGDRLADHLRRRAALVELRDLPGHRHARRHRPGRPPRPTGGQFFAIFADGHNRQLPKLVGGPFRYKNYAADSLSRSIGYAHQPDEAGGDRAVDARAALPAGRGGAGLLPRSSSRTTWSTSARRTSAGPSPPARPGCRSTSPRAGWPPATTRATRGPARGMLPPLHRAEQPGASTGSPPRSGATSACTPAPAATATRCTARTCRTATCCRRCSSSNAGYFLMQLASERDRDPVYQLVGEHSRDDANGVAQMCYVGVISPVQPAAESAGGGPRPAGPSGELHPEGAARLDRRLRLLAVLASTRSRSHGSPDYARDVAFQKIRNRVEGTRMAAEKLGHLGRSSSSGVAVGQDQAAGRVPGQRLGRGDRRDRDRAVHVREATLDPDLGRHPGRVDAQQHQVAGVGVEGGGDRRPAGPGTSSARSRPRPGSARGSTAGTTRCGRPRPTPAARPDARARSRPP